MTLPPSLGVKWENSRDLRRHARGRPSVTVAVASIHPSGIATVVSPGGVARGRDRSWGEERKGRVVRQSFCFASVVGRTAGRGRIMIDWRFGQTALTRHSRAMTPGRVAP